MQVSKKDLIDRTHQSRKWLIFYVLIVVFPYVPLLTFQILVKLNSLGVVSLFYLLFFIFYSSIDGGERGGGLWRLYFFYLVEINFTGLRNPLKDDSCKPFNSTAVFLSGVLLVSFFVHNLLIPIFRNQAKPEVGFLSSCPPPPLFFWSSKTRAIILFALEQYSRSSNRFPSCGSIIWCCWLHWVSGVIVLPLIHHKLLLQNKNSYWLIFTLATLVKRTIPTLHRIFLTPSQLMTLWR